MRSKFFTPSTPDAFRLIMEGQAAFADIEENGMRIDEAYLDAVLKETGNRIREMENDLQKDEFYQQWKRIFKDKAGLDKRQQLGFILYDVLKLEPHHFTETGRPKVDEDALEEIDIPFIRNYNMLAKLKKARNTYLADIRRNTHEGYVRAFLNLHLARTYRSSGDSPNLQNQPVRSKAQAKLIRQCFIPRGPNYTLMEFDQKALEFKGAACKWEDPQLIAYASDPSLDIHRDMAAECYWLSLDQVSKDARSYAKNQIVFPLLYGSYYVSCSKNLWAQIGRGKLTRKDGVGLYDHLAEKGITKLVDYWPNGEKKTGTYEAHIQKVEEHFHERFPIWSKNRDVWWDQYLKNGWFPLQTGFVCVGLFSYNFLQNCPIQGPSFHIVLWAIIEINKELKRRKMKSKVICTIHDSIIIDAHNSEIDDVFELAVQKMTIDVRRHWEWIVTPLQVECEASAVSWFHKKPLAI